jgi:hypothetical protein
MDEGNNDHPEHSPKTAPVFKRAQAVSYLVPSDPIYDSCCPRVKRYCLQVSIKNIGNPAMADGLIPVDELTKSSVRDGQRDPAHQSNQLRPQGFEDEKYSYSNEPRQQQHFSFEDEKFSTPQPTHSQSYGSAGRHNSGYENEKQASPYQSTRQQSYGLGDEKWDYGQRSGYQDQKQNPSYQTNHQPNSGFGDDKWDYGQRGYQDQKQNFPYQPSEQRSPSFGDEKHGYVHPPHSQNYGTGERQGSGYGFQQQSPPYQSNQPQGPSRGARLGAQHHHETFHPVQSHGSGYSNNPNDMDGIRVTPMDSHNFTQQQRSRFDTGPQVVPTNSRQIPEQLDMSNVMVPYKTVPMKVDTEHHVVKAVLASTESVQNVSNILGTYLEEKRANEVHRLGTTSLGPYKRSKLEVQMYNHLMHKLETLSADVVGKHKKLYNVWVQALGPHRRRVFADLYNENALVRSFCKEMADGPMALPQLDGWALGIEHNPFFSHRASSRPLRVNASTELLAQVRTVALVDDSGSMRDSGHMSWNSNPDYRNVGYGGSSESRWEQARRTLAEVAPLVSERNPHGVDIHFLNRTDFYLGLRTTLDVEVAFDKGYPGGGTLTGQRINDILDSYMCTLRYNRTLMPLNLIVLTDGESQDEDHLHWAIEEHVTKIVQRGYPAHQFGIEFVQVGDDEMATRHLEKLEEEVSRHHQKFQRDVVGVTPTTRMSNMNSDKLLAIAVSGIDARINGYMRQRGTNV